MAQKTWLEYVNEKFLFSFFRDYGRRVSANIYDVESVKLIDDATFGKIARIKNKVMIDKDLELNFGNYEFTYFCDFCELKKTKKGFVPILPKCFEDTNSAVGLAFPRFMKKYTSSIKNNNCKSYIQDYSKFMTKLLNIKRDEAMGKIINEYNNYFTKLSLLEKEENRITY